MSPDDGLPPHMRNQHPADQEVDYPLNWSEQRSNRSVFLDPFAFLQPSISSSRSDVPLQRACPAAGIQLLRGRTESDDFAMKLNRSSFSVVVFLLALLAAAVNTACGDGGSPTSPTWAGRSEQTH